MDEFYIRVGKEKVCVKFIIGLLCVTYRRKTFLIEHCPENGWLFKVGKMPAETFIKITESIEEYV
jgi:hypothetical protein